MNACAPTYREFLDALAQAPGAGVVEPTDEQRAVIFSQEPAVLVMAGAGSGKTATMSQKIAWHIAQGYVRPDQVLGLTFTRKAAGELADRVARHVEALSRAGYVRMGEGEFERPTISTYDSFAGDIASSYALVIGKDPRSRLITEAERWQIMDRIVREWPYTKDLAPCALNTDISTLVKVALSLASAITANGVSVEDVGDYVRQETDAIARIDRVRIQERTFNKNPYRGTHVSDALKPFIESVKPAKNSDGSSALHLRMAVLPFVRAYERYKQEHGLAEFVDYMAWAGEILHQAPHIAAALRSSYKLVLLDEYQDTAASQAQFLRRAFYRPNSTDMSVVAVGDPQQAIYGWRGAGANALADFARDFHVPSKARLSLSTAFRNSTNILAAANALTESARYSDPYRAYRSEYEKLKEVDLICETIKNSPHRWRSHHSLAIAQLQPAPHAQEGRVIHVHRARRESMYGRIAHYISEFFSQHRLQWPSNETYQAPTAAVLVRKRSYVPLMVQALQKRGIRYEILAGESMMKCQEVRLIRALMAAAFLPSRNNMVLYVLNFFAIGVEDLQALHAWARVLEKRAHEDGDLSLAGSVDLADVLESALAQEGAARIHTYVRVPVAEQCEEISFSPEGWERIIHVARIVHNLRSLGNMSIEKVVRSAIDALHLDTFAQTRTSGTGKVRRKLAKLVRVAQEYDETRKTGSAMRESFAAEAFAAESSTEASDMASAPSSLPAQEGGMADFLCWLDECEQREHADTDDSSSDVWDSIYSDIEPQSGVVQILTIHSAKGLEWDLVAVPEMVQEEFDALAPEKARIWHKDKEAFPWPLRLDSEHIPQLSIHEVVGDRAVTSDIVAEVAARAWAFTHSDLPDYETAENRRLAYVALTRPRTELIIGTSSYIESVRVPTLKKAIRIGSEHKNIAELYEQIKQYERPHTFVSDIEQSSDHPILIDTDTPPDHADEHAQAVWLKNVLGDRIPLFAMQYLSEEDRESENSNSGASSESGGHTESGHSESDAGVCIDHAGECIGESHYGGKYDENKIMHNLVRAENYLRLVNSAPTHSSESIAPSSASTELPALPEGMVQWPCCVDRRLDKENPQSTQLVGNAARVISDSHVEDAVNQMNAAVRPDHPARSDFPQQPDCSELLDCLEPPDHLGRLDSPDQLDSPELAGQLSAEEKEAIKKRWHMSADIAIAEHQQGVGGQFEPEQPMMSYLTASGIVHLESDPEKYLLNQRRPVPQEPSDAAYIGTAVHEKIANYFSAPLSLDIDNVDERYWGSLDSRFEDDCGDCADSQILFQRARDSRFASMPVLAIEKRIETVIAGYPVRCVIDAVFDTRDYSGASVTIVDWKTGRRPSGRALKARSFQLAVYRYAWARAHHSDPRDIDAIFYYLGEEDPRQRELHCEFIPEEELSRFIADALSGRQK